MELTGTIKSISNVQNPSATFRKRELVLTTEEQYPQSILVEFTQDKCDLLDKFKVGQSVTVGINLRGREWVNPSGDVKYFNSIIGWKINATESAPPTPHFEPAPAHVAEDHNDLPF